jgi:hypothetical protein
MDETEEKGGCISSITEADPMRAWCPEAEA